MDTDRPLLVTGAAGFIGFNLSRKLLSEGYRVVGLDNLNDYYPTIIKHARWGMLQEQPGFTPVQADLADAGAVRALVAEHKPQIVCHLAAQAGVRYSLEHPEAYTLSNVEGTLHILEACRHEGVERLVYASSSSVYGGNKKTPFSEDDPVNTPISLYAATKRSCELMAHVYTHLFGLPTVGMRFFTVYGPWGRPDMALWIFTEKILAGQPIPLFNGGKMQRDFTYVDDIIQGLWGALFADGLAPYELFNLGGHRCEELGHMVELIEQSLGREAIKNLLPMQPGDVPSTEADIERARTKLGYNPQTHIDEGVPRFVEWYQAHSEITSEVKTWREVTGGR